MADDAKQTDVVVLGAGMVGVSSALSARERGMSVILVDRREPGSETSYGNAGILSSGSIFPLNTPALFDVLPKYLTNTHPALRWSLFWSLRNADWIVRFLANALPGQTKPRAAALRVLCAASLKLHREWIVKAGAPQRDCRCARPSANRFPGYAQAHRPARSSRGAASATR